MELTRGRRWPSWVLSTALVGGCLALTVLAVKTPWAHLPRPVIAVAGVVGSAAQWRRRRWPHLAALAGAASMALAGNPGPWLVGLYAGAAYAPRRQVWLPGAAAWLGFVAWSWLDAGRLRTGDAVYGALGVAVVLVAGIWLATREALLGALREQAERAETERRLRDERARTAERTRIAREMHDVLAHKVSLIALYSGALELRTDGDARDSAALIRITAREALQELRSVLGMLREPGPESPPLELASLAAAGPGVELRDTAGTLPPATARVVYRVVQEGLTNARKHAPGAPVTVSVERNGDGGVTVTVHNGRPDTGPADLPGSGSGLIGLAERIRLVGGVLRSGPDARGGWELSAEVPWLDPHIEERPAEADQR